MIVVYRLPYRWFTTDLSYFKDIYESNVVDNYFRNKFIADLSENLRKSGKTSFVMVRHIAHGLALKAMIPGSIFVQGLLSSDKRAALYSDLQDKKLHCIITTVGKEGLNIPRLDAVINAEGLKAHTLTMQKMRSLTATETKKYGIVIDFLDRGRYLTKHSKRRIDYYQAIGDAKILFRDVPPDIYPMEGSRWRN
jgi:superfamily II DNA or RNA helicase